MTRYAKLLVATAAMVACTGAYAQTNGSNSSYSRFGLGIPTDQSQGFNKGMAGVGVGLAPGNRVNIINPASYARIDSLSFIFDVGMNASFGNMKSKGSSINVNNCNIDYVCAGLQLRRGLGLSFGFVPYTSIGYSFSIQSRVGTEIISSQPITKTDYYNGSGGLNQAYIGVGGNIYRGLSAGANIGMIWGSYNHSVAEEFSEGNSNSSSYSGLNSIHAANLKSYKIDLGIQYPVTLTRRDRLTAGVIAGIGHKIKGESTLRRYTNGDTDPQPKTADDAFDIPFSYGVGLGWEHRGNLAVGLDFRHELWSGCHTPQYDSTTGEYAPATGTYKDRFKVAAGTQYTVNPFEKKYWKRIQYKMGVHYSTPYLKINGADGPREYGLTLGASLPVTNNYNSRSAINVSLQWLRRAPSTTSMITENYFMVNFGLTFNEQWFMKFKIK